MKSEGSCNLILILMSQHCGKDWYAEASSFTSPMMLWSHPLFPVCYTCPHSLCVFGRPTNRIIAVFWAVMHNGPWLTRNLSHNDRECPVKNHFSGNAALHMHYCCITWLFCQLALMICTANSIVTQMKLIWFTTSFYFFNAMWFELQWKQQQSHFNVVNRVLTQLSLFPEKWTINLSWYHPLPRVALWVGLSFWKECIEECGSWTTASVPTGYGRFHSNVVFIHENIRILKYHQRHHSYK